MITFSIVTITYNADNVLGKTVDSVFSQTYPHVEHVIIDGASTDDTLQVAQDYMQLLTGMRYVLCQNPITVCTML